MNSKYLEFLKSKQNVATDAGFEVDDLNPKLYEYEHDMFGGRSKKGNPLFLQSVASEKRRCNLSLQIRFADTPERASWW